MAKEQWRKNIEAVVKEASEKAGLRADKEVMVIIADSIGKASKEHALNLKSGVITSSEFKAVLSVTIKNAIVSEPKLARISGLKLRRVEKTVDGLSIDKIGKALCEEPWWPK